MSKGFNGELYSKLSNELFNYEIYLKVITTFDGGFELCHTEGYGNETFYYNCPEWSDVERETIKIYNQIRLKKLERIVND